MLSAPALALPVMIYRPDPGTRRHSGCRTCEHFHGEWLAGGAHVLCRLAPGSQVQASPARGCAFHCRAPGSD